MRYDPSCQEIGHDSVMDTILRWHRLPAAISTYVLEGRLSVAVFRRYLMLLCSDISLESPEQRRVINSDEERACTAILTCSI